MVGIYVDKVIGDLWDVMNKIFENFEGKVFLFYIVDDKFVVDNICVG